jgi:hypothetical protein
MFSDIREGESVEMCAYQGVFLDGITLHHKGSEVVFNLKPKEGRYGPPLWKMYERKGMTPHHLLAYYNKYVAHKDPYHGDIWKILTVGKGSSERTLSEIREESKPWEPPHPRDVLPLPCIEGLPEHLVAGRNRLLEELEKWNTVMKAHLAIKRLEASAKGDEERLVKKLQKREWHVHYNEKKLARLQVYLARCKADVVETKAEIEKKATELTTAKAMLASYTA